MGAFLATLATLVILLLGGAFAAPYVIDWNDYRDVFERQASKVVGREVKVRGGVALTILPAPRLKFENVAIADSGGRFEAPFADAQSFDMMLSLSALLTGAVEAESVSLVKPVLRVSFDAGGRGDWLDLGPVESGFTPREVTLNKVSIEDGALEIAGPGVPAPVRIGAVNGEFAADSRQGPFKFTGSAALAGATRDIRFSAAKRPGGAYALKASAAFGPWSVALDGALASLDAAPEYQGAATVKATLGDPARPLSLEGKAQAKASLKEARLTDVAISIADDARPQTLTGAAALAFGPAPRLEIEGDADWTSAALLGVAPGDAWIAAQNAVDALGARLGPNGEAALRLNLAELALTDGEIRNISLDARYADGAVALAALKATVPGEAEVRLSGRLSGAGDARRFEGDGEVAGANFARLLKWALGAGDRGGPLAKNFALRGRLSHGPGGTRLSSAAGELGGSAFNGDVEYAPGERFSAALISDRLDLRGVVSPAFEWRGLLGEAKEPAVSVGGAASLTTLLARLRGLPTASVSLKAGVIEFDEREARNVSADFALTRDTLSVSTLQFVTADGLRLVASGKLAALSSAPDGEMKASLDAQTPEAVAALASAFGVDGATEAAARASALAPMKAAGVLKARGSAGAFDYKLDGLAGASPFSVEGRVNTGEGGSMRSLALEAWMSNANGGELLAQISPGVGLDAAAGRGPGSASLSASGALDESVDVKLDLKTSAISAAFAGRANISKTPFELAGDISASASQNAAAAAWALVSQAPAPPVQSVSLSAALQKTGDAYQLLGLTVTADGAAAKGSASVTLTPAGFSGAATLSAETASAPRLFAMALNGPPRDDSGEGSPWPERPFAAPAFASPGFDLALSAGSLDLGAGLTLRNAQLAASLGGGSLRVTKLEGESFNGRFAAQGALKAERDRYVLSGRVALDDARLEALFLTAGPGASGAVSLDARVQSQGVSPRGLIANLSGKGKLSFGAGALRRFSPAGLDWTGAEAPAAAAATGPALEKALAQLIRQNDFAYKKLRAPFTIRNGAMLVRRASFTGGGQSMRAQIEADLSSLRFDSEWRLGGGRGRKTPSVSVTFAGPIADLARTPMMIDADDYQRFLAVRKMERDVERLERLNLYGAPPEPPPLPGARVDRRGPPPPGPVRGGVERRELVPLPSTPPPPTPRPDDPYGWRPLIETSPGGPGPRAGDEGPPADADGRSFADRIRPALAGPPGAPV
ncbi:MAG: AsmA family protein, partial [Hyphomicrobiales bacterium]|nr:AsmA family protein [Hyphomicrobiales bacterium]